MDGPVVLAGRIVRSPTEAIEWNVSRDGGATWRPTPHRIPSLGVRDLQLFVEGDALFARADLGPSIVWWQSDDFGATWRALDGMDSDVLWTSPSDVVSTRLVPVGGDLRVYAYVLAGHTSLGTGTPGTGGVVPQLRGVGIPTIGRSFSYAVSDAVPNAIGGVFVSFGSPVPATLGAATVFVQPPAFTFLFTTSASGQASVPIALPPNPAYAGLSLTSQALILDPNAAFGFASTRAIESWTK